MRIELNVNLRPARPEPEAKPVVGPEVVVKKRCRAREERLLRRIAVAQVVEARIAEGEFADLADAARHCGVSRAQMSMIMGWRGN
jgi:hypothetical protein